MGENERKIKPARTSAVGILNPWGELWTYKTFDHADEARAYVERYWREFPGKANVDTGKYEVVPVRVTVSVIQSAKG